jgi:hypothetical protein
MSDHRDMDEKLGALLRGSEQPADDGFVARVERLIEAERRMERQRRAAWRRFAAEALASAAVALAFVLIARLDPGSGGGGAGEVDLAVSSPAMAAAMLIGLWLAVGFRPAAAGK